MNMHKKLRASTILIGLNLLLMLGIGVIVLFTSDSGGLFGSEVLVGFYTIPWLIPAALLLKTFGIQDLGKILDTVPWGWLLLMSGIIYTVIIYLIALVSRRLTRFAK